jgi:hypothetical protein
MTYHAIEVSFLPYFLWHSEIDTIEEGNYYCVVILHVVFKGQSSNLGSRADPPVSKIPGHSFQWAAPVLGHATRRLILDGIWGLQHVLEPQSRFFVSMYYVRGGPWG